MSQIRIGNDTFMVPPPRGTATFGLQQKIIPIAGRLVSVVLHVMGKKGVEDLDGLLEKDVMKSLPAALPYLGEVFSQMPEGELERVLRVLLGDTLWLKGREGIRLFGSGDGDVYDAVFQGRTIDQWKLLFHALKVWYPDFFALAATSPGPPGDAARPSVSPTTSSPSGPVIDSSTSAG